MVGKHAKKEVVKLERQRKLLVNLMQFKEKNKTMIMYFGQEGANAIVLKFLERNFMIFNLGKKTLWKGINPKGYPFAPT